MLTVGIIEDHRGYTDSVLMCFEDDPVRFHCWDGFREFSGSPRRCDLIVVDLGEIRNPTLDMRLIEGFTNEVIFNSGFAVPVTLREIEAIARDWPDMVIRYGDGVDEIDEVLRALEG
jgi:hypothetical protein